MPADEHLSDQFKSVYESEHGQLTVNPAGYVNNFYVKEEQRGKGHGSAIGAQLLADADRLGKPLYAHAREELHGWYKKAGFEVKENHPLDFMAGASGPGVPFLVREPRRRAS
jgi:GNAT superfamily N-acetyltransferase